MTACDAERCGFAVLKNEAQARVIADCAIAAIDFPEAECPIQAKWANEDAEGFEELIKCGIKNEDGTKGSVDEADEIVFAAMTKEGLA